MAELVLSAFLTVLIEKLASTALKSIASYKEIDVEIRKWKRWLKQIQCVLTDASQKEITNDSVKQWLNDLQHLAYDIDDILDDLATTSMHHEFAQESQAITSKVWKLIPICCTNFSWGTRMHDKLANITAKLHELVEEKSTLGLCVQEERRSNNINRRLQTSIVHASSIVGRQAEKEALVRKLLGDEPCDENFSIVPIVGMGGVGKTTLARLLYDEKKVKDHFELKAWVCVSDEFDSFHICKVIYQSLGGVIKENYSDLNLLQVDLRNILREKKFLLVLDDIWSESYEDWETLVAPFHACAHGSKIIMTTRKDQLLKKLGYNNPNQQLQSLLYEDALSLVALHALGVTNFDSHLSLKPYGEGIVKKCDGLPLALIALGRLLRTKEEEDSWKEVLESKIWLSKDDTILPALRLSYHDLSARLKQLFAYCSLFPKDYVFDKEELVLMWMAEGFLHQSPPSDSTEEHMGYEYFDEFLSRSFFQHAPNNESMFVMHDMINDLATSVASEFFVRLDIEANKDIRLEIVEKCRHLSFIRETYVAYKKFEAFKRAKSLRTFLATSAGVVEMWHHFYMSNRSLIELLPELRLLRVLSLSNFHISEVPESIGTLRHLRYLNLSQTRITHLPESVCNLYYLQTLIVFSCNRLTKLPKSLFKLKNLRHLDIRDTKLLDDIPLGISELKSLQTLSKIIIKGDSGFQITELRELKNLCGKISIVGLEKVQNAKDACNASISQKRLTELDFRWSDDLDGSRNEILEKEVLNELRPHNSYLKHLKIRSYLGLEFPVWVGDPSFIRLKHVSIYGCKKSRFLPPLGQLPSLKELLIEGLEGVKFVGMELLGTRLECPSLEILSFVDMQGWEKWSTNDGNVFPCLRELYIRNCPNLVEVSLERLPSLNVLKTIRCHSGVLKRLVQIASSVTKLNIYHISGLNDVVWRSVMHHLGAVKDLSIKYCNEIRYMWTSEAVASKVLVNLRKLKVNSCDNLVSLGEKEDKFRSNLLTSLTMLDVSHCINMERCSCPYSIETLNVYNCTSMTVISFPTGGQKLKSFDIRYCRKLLETKWGGIKINDNRRRMPVLEVADITDWSNLKSIIELNYLVHLTTLKIINCRNLESFPDNELSNLNLLKCIHITDCPSLDACFPRGIWPPKLHSLTIGKLRKSISDWGPQNFPNSVVELYLHGDDGVDDCCQLSHLLPSSLTSLEIHDFKKLESFSMRLRQLTSLQHLGIYDCPIMMNLPEVLHSLLSLRISHCPILKERCSKGGRYQTLISHIPCIIIDPQSGT
ncbi:hypothetical protein E3N88_08049 [Mikania micrantha]|uniref:NB-ARC domain-containing protein n=1 Tax=Mikania micrantha TaxID=192012 RepID=A0A5N6PF93_9ASTR|nr:hypothetical protein E3N88_08049 [Mikania micrantha]